MAIERTLSIVKPDAVAKNVIGKITTRFEDAEHLLAASDALLVAGSSLVVNSGIRLLERARRRKLPVVIVNRGETRGDARATVKINAGTTEVLQALAEALPGVR